MDQHTLLSSFGKWASPIDFKKLHAQIIQSGQDLYTKKLTTERYIQLLLLSHLEEVDSLHEMSDTLCDDDIQYALGMDPISVSQLARKHGAVDPNLLVTIFQQLVVKIHQGEPKRLRRPLKIIDSSTLLLNLTNHPWATFRKTKAGVKLHLRLVFMENGMSYPEYAAVTTANEHDWNQLEVLIGDQTATYVFDRDYLDYECFDRMTDDSYFSVLRIKKNTITRTLETFDTATDHTLLRE